MTKLIFFMALFLSFSFFSFATDIKQITKTTAYLYQNLIQFIVPTTSHSCSSMQNIVNLYNQVYPELANLTAYTFIKPIFNQNVAKVNTMIKNGQCIPDNTDTPQVPVPQGETQFWVLGYFLATWFHPSLTEEHQSMGISLKFIDRVPNSIGGYVWSIDPSHNVAFINGTSGAWTSVTGINANYLRISLYDLTVYAIDTSNNFYWVAQGQKTFTRSFFQMQFKTFDVSPKDGQVYGVKSDNTLWVSAGANKPWSQISGSVEYVRVISNGAIFAINSSDGSLLFKISNNDEWTTLTGVNALTFVDVNQQGMIYGIRSDNTVWSRQYMNGEWALEEKSLLTLRVFDDNSVIGVGVHDYADSSNGNLYYKSNGNEAWTQMPDWAFTLWGPTNCVYWF